MVPQMAGMSGMMHQMGSRMMQGMRVAAGGSRVGVAQSTGDNVYWPSLDFLIGGSHACTPLETQYSGVETFSLEDLDISPMRETPNDVPLVVGRRGSSTRKSKKKDKGRGKDKDKNKGVVGESSQAVGEEAADDEEEAGGRRTAWTPEECVALSKAWISVCDDPIMSSNQQIDKTWARIRDAYKIFKSADGRHGMPKTIGANKDRRLPICRHLREQLPLVDQLPDHRGREELVAPAVPSAQGVRPI